jgi:hypothetical protein
MGIEPDISQKRICLHIVLFWLFLLEFNEPEFNGRIDRDNGKIRCKGMILYNNDQ